MDRKMLKLHLAQAKVHIETGRKNIARQRKAIAKLECEGQDAKEARAALAQFEELQAMHGCGARLAKQQEGAREVPREEQQQLRAFS